MNKSIQWTCLVLGLSCLTLAQAYAPVESRDDSYQLSASSQNMSQQPLVPAQQRVDGELTTDQQRLESLSHIDELQTQVQTLRGQIEQQQHQIEQLQLVQREMYSDLDSRLKQLTSPKSTNTTATPASSAVPSVPAAMTDKDVLNQQQLYQKAYDSMSARRYSDAKVALQSYVQQYPQGTYAANAHYWLGELSLMGGDNSQAQREFATVVKDYPKSQKVADASLKLGYMSYEQGQWQQAKTYLQNIVSLYPNTSSAQLATQRLEQMKREGH
jgi:tol-pal system protein YbgF